VIEQAKTAEDEIVEALRQAGEPVRHAALARTLNAKPTTLSLRLKRLSEKGLVRRDNDTGAWSATATL
jgi:DNA-binding IclR family transcriptional regulator